MDRQKSPILYLRQVDKQITILRETKQVLVHETKQPKVFQLCWLKNEC